MYTLITICYAIVCTIAALGVWCVVVSTSKCLYQRWHDNKRGYKPYCTLKEKIRTNPSFKLGLNLLTWGLVSFLVLAVFGAFCRLFWSYVLPT